MGTRSVEFKGTYVEVHSDGDKTLEFAQVVWREVKQCCEENHCFKVLGIARTTTPISTMEGWDHKTLFKEIGIDHRFEIAWTELNVRHLEQYVFIENVLANRAIVQRVKIFGDVAEARSWLGID